MSQNIHSDEILEKLQSENAILQARVAELESLAQNKKAKNINERNFEELFRSLINNIQEGVAIIDENDILLYCNEAYANIYEDSTFTLIGKSVREMDEESFHDAIKYRREESKQGASSIYEVDIITKSKLKKSISVSTEPYFINDKYSGVLASLSDVTDLQDTKLKLRESELRFRQLADNTPILIMMTETNGDCTMVNRSWLDYTGRNLSLENKQGWLDNLHPEDVKKMTIILENSLMNLREHALECRIKNKEGIYKHFYFTIAPRYSVKNEFAGLLCVCIDISQEKEAIELISANEKRMERLFDISPFGIILNNENGTNYINQAAIDIFEISSVREAKNFDLFKYIKQSESEEARNRLDKLDNFAEQAVSVFNIVTSDNIEKCIEITDSYINENKEILTVIRDITENIKRQNEIEENRRLLRTIIDANPNHIYLKDSSANMIISNMTHANLYGLEPQDVEGRNQRELFASAQLSLSELKMLLEFDNEAIESDSPIFINKFQFTAINGEKRWLQITKIPMKASDDSRRILSIAVDVTDLVNFSEALSRERDLVKNIIEFSPDSIVIFDLDGRITDCNKAALDLLKYDDKKEIYLTSVYSYISEIESERALAVRESLYKNGIVKNIEFELVCKNGDNISANFSIALVKDSNGKPICAVEILQDLTDRKKNEAELMDIIMDLSEANQVVEQYTRDLYLSNEKIRESEQALMDINANKDALFSIISHDLKSPFSGVIAFTKLLIDDLNNSDYESAKNIADDLKTTEERLYRLLENLLDWARVNMGRIVPSPEILELTDYIRLNASLFESNAEQKQITFEIKIEKDLLVFADSNMLNTTLRNLISNALKFSYPGSKIIIESKVVNSLAMISVQDFGAGMSPDNVEKLFALNRHFSTLGTNKEAGTGLGLMVCKEMVAKNGGEIWAKSVLNVGTTFTFTVPLAKDEQIQESLTGGTSEEEDILSQFLDM